MYPDGIFLHPDIYNALMDTIERDCRALESLRIMDYSLLLGIHFCKDSKMASCVGGGESIVGYSDDPAAGGSSGAEDSENGDGYSSRRNYPPPLELKQRLVAHSTPLESITADMDDHYSMDGTSEQADKISTWGGIPAKTKNGENLLIFLGTNKVFYYLISYCFWVLPKSFFFYFFKSKTGSKAHEKYNKIFFP